MKEFKGKALCLDRADINTDEIIPARYLTETEKMAMKPHLLEDLELHGFDPKENLEGVRVILAGGNFGCGSSREHAPWALEVNNINVVIAPGFARIFRQNMFNCGMMAIELPEQGMAPLVDLCKKGETEISVDLEASMIRAESSGETLEVAFSISEFDRALVRAGGWVEYADQHY